MHEEDLDAQLIAVMSQFEGTIATQEMHLKRAVTLINAKIRNEPNVKNNIPLVTASTSKLSGKEHDNDMIHLLGPIDPKVIPNTEKQLEYCLKAALVMELYKSTERSSSPDSAISEGTYAESDENDDDLDVGISLSNPETGSDRTPTTDGIQSVTRGVPLLREFTGSVGNSTSNPEMGNDRALPTDGIRGATSDVPKVREFTGSDGVKVMVNVFAYPSRSLVHCVSADFHMRAGIALSTR